MVALNGLNGSQLHGRWRAPTTLPTVLPTKGRNIDHVTHIDIQGTDTPRHDASRVTENASPSAGDPAPWPAPDPFDVERARLMSEIATAKERATSVRASIASRETEMRAALRTEFAAARRVLDEMESEHATKIAAVRTAVETEVARILAEARRTRHARIGVASASDPIGAWDAD